MNWFEIIKENEVSWACRGSFDYFIDKIYNTGSRKLASKYLD
jgi:hypothetical protein